MIDSLLRAALPVALHALVPRLVVEAAARPYVAQQVRKRWGELSESEGNLVAREVGLVARGAIDGVPPQPERHLHQGVGVTRVDR